MSPVQVVLVDYSYNAVQASRRYSVAPVEDRDTVYTVGLSALATAASPASTMAAIEQAVAGEHGLEVKVVAVRAELVAAPGNDVPIYSLGLQVVP